MYSPIQHQMEQRNDQQAIATPIGMAEQTQQYAINPNRMNILDIQLIPFYDHTYRGSDLFGVWDRSVRIGTLNVDGNRIGISLHTKDSLPMHSFYKDWSLFEAIEVIQQLNYKG